MIELTEAEKDQVRMITGSYNDHVGDEERAFEIVGCLMAARLGAVEADWNTAYELLREQRDDLRARLDVAAIHYVARESDMSVDICNHMSLEDALAKLDRWEKLAMDVTTYLEREEEDDRRSISTLAFAMACARKAIDEVLLGAEG